MRLTLAPFAVALCLTGTACAQVPTEDDAIAFVKSVYSSATAEYLKDPQASPENLLDKFQGKPWILGELTVVQKDGTKKVEPDEERKKRVQSFIISLAKIFVLTSEGMKLEGEKGMFAKLERGKPDEVPEALRPFGATIVKWTIELDGEVRKKLAPLTRVEFTIYLVDYARRLDGSPATGKPDWRIFVVEQKITREENTAPASMAGVFPLQCKYATKRFLA